ncbi:trypsin-like serine protease [Grimontia sedimenti]|uniref:trypsin-like serine protease n=1 Tax=Grimontia sedimenti TaxID=2711294 RepID=UPI0022A722E3|nr:trypsin-like serine protease [Grimontia sedimenti]
MDGVDDSTCFGYDHNGVYSSFICANSSEPTGICYGDSGGPLIWQDPLSTNDSDKGYVAVGVVSFTSVEGCGTVNNEDGFTQIASYYGWISAQMGGYQKPDVTFEMDLFNLRTDYEPDRTIPLVESTSGGGGSLPLWLLTLMLPVILIRASRNKTIS